MMLKTTTRFFDSKTNECTFTITGTKSIFQEQYNCEQCCTPQICSYCYYTCHKKMNHRGTRQMKQKGYFYCQCAVNGHKIIPKEQIQQEKCIIYPIFERSRVICQKCDLSLCLFCAQESFHQYHINELKLTQNSEACQCNDDSHHQTHQFRGYLLKYYKIFISQSHILDENFDINQYRLMVDKIHKSYQQQKLLRLFNLLFQREQIYQGLLYPIKKHLDEIQNFLEGGNPDEHFHYGSTIEEFENQNQTIQEKIQEYFCPVNFDYSFVKSIMQLIRLLGEDRKLSKRFLILSDKIEYTFNSDLMQFLITNNQQIGQLLDDQSRDQLSIILNNVLDLQMILIKKRFVQFRKIETKTIDSTDPLSRLKLREYNRDKDLKLCVETEFLLKKYLKMIGDNEISNQFSRKLFNFILILFKLSIKCRIFNEQSNIVEKLLKQIQKLFKNVKYQQINLFNENVHLILTDILIHSYFMLKDQQFMNYLNSKEQLRIYDNNNEQFQQIYSILLQVQINSILYSKSFKRQQTLQKQLNYNVSRLLREQFFANTIYADQVLSLDSWKFVNYLYKTQNQDLKSIKLSIDQQIQSIVLQSDSLTNSLNNLHTLLNSILSSNTISQYIHLIRQQQVQYNLIKEVNQFNQIFNDNNESYSQMSYDIDQDHNELSMWNLHRIQMGIYSSGLDQSLISILYYKHHIFPLSNYQNSSLFPLYQKILIKVFSLLHLYIYFNPNSLRQILQKNNLKIFTSYLTFDDQYNQHDQIYFNTHKMAFDQLITFYSKIINNHIFYQENIKMKPIFLNFQIFIEHLQKIFVMTHMQYQDINEISYYLAIHININKSAIITIIFQILNHINQKPLIYEDYQYTNCIFEFLEESLFPNMLTHLKELFNDLTKSINLSDSINYFSTTTIKYTKVSIYQCFAQLTIVKQEINNHFSNSNEDSDSSNFLDNSMNDLVHITTDTLNKILDQFQNQTSLQSRMAISTLVLVFQYFRLMNLVLERQSKTFLVDSERYQVFYELMEILYQNQDFLLNESIQLIDLRLEISKFLNLLFEKQIHETIVEAYLQQDDSKVFYQDEDNKNEKHIILQGIMENLSTVGKLKDVEIIEDHPLLLRSIIGHQNHLLKQFEDFDKAVQIIQVVEGIKNDYRQQLFQILINQIMVKGLENLMNILVLLNQHKVVNTGKIDLMVTIKILQYMMNEKHTMRDIVHRNVLSTPMLQMHHYISLSEIKDSIIKRKSKLFQNLKHDHSPTTKKKYLTLKIEDVLDKYNDIMDATYKDLINLSKTDDLIENRQIKSKILTIEQLISLYFNLESKKKTKLQNLQMNIERLIQRVKQLSKQINLNNYKNVFALFNQTYSRQTTFEIKIKKNLEIFSDSKEYLLNPQILWQLNKYNCDIQEQLKQIINNKGQSEEQLEQQTLIQLIIRSHKTKDLESIGNIILDLFANMMKQQSQFTLLEQTKFSYYQRIFIQQLNIVKTFLRMMILETKIMQNLIIKNLQKEEFNLQFKQSLQYFSQHLLPQLFANIIHSNLMFHIQVIITSGYYSRVFLEFIRYLAEGQNSYMQIYLGEIGVLENLLKLFVDLIKSNQISNLLKQIKSYNQPDQFKQSNSQSKKQFKDMVQKVKMQRLLKSQTQMIRLFTENKQKVKKQKVFQNEFLIFHQGDQEIDEFKLRSSKTFLKLYAHTIITIAEINLGNCNANQKLTFDYLTKYKIWPLILKILTIRTKNVHQNSIFTLRTYLFELILSLLDEPEKSSTDFMFIMNQVNYKLLEESLQQTYLRLIQINNLAMEKHGQIENIDQMSILLSEMYKQHLGDNINESIVFDQKLLIKSLYQIYKMLNIYSRVNHEVQEYLQRNTERQDPLIKSAFDFIFSIVGSIEYVDDTQQLETFHFLIPPKCYFLSSETKFQFEFQILDRTNPQSKLASILEVIPTFMIEMDENIKKYRKSRFQSLMVKIMISPKFHHKQFSILLILLNFITILLISSNYKMTVNQDFSLEQQISNQRLIKLSSILLALCSLLGLLCQLFFRMSIYYKLLKDYGKINAIYNLLTQREIIQFILHFSLSLLGSLVDPFFFYLESFCFIYISKTMYSVMLALKLRWKSFMGIFLMIMIILNLYSYVGYIRFTTSFQQVVMIHTEQDITEEETLCDSPLHCFLSLIYIGLRDGNGLGAFGDNESYYKSQDYFPRFMYDFTFFIIITLVMLNIINGVIIDTFAELRDQQQRNEYDIKNICIICSLERYQKVFLQNFRWQFEKRGQSFEKHIRETHNIWNYVSFLVHLNMVGKDNMIGIETQIYQKLKIKDSSWIPQLSTRSLLSI